ncbi:hypothetical protein VmeM32_00161 [Vibrio phage vB_VmeM-32]|nr:hypothetical protein VmeM32_00161 [Vibrio phage vB_VmeM-32]
MSQLRLGTQIGGNLAWHQGNLEFVPDVDSIRYKTLDVITSKGGQNINGSLTATQFNGSLSGNATTATTLQTARTINGTSFNGSANITTANWGTARNITIGNTAKSVNGSSNVSWTLDEIGAVNSTPIAGPVDDEELVKYITESNRNSIIRTIHSYPLLDGHRVVLNLSAQNNSGMQIAARSTANELHVRSIGQNGAGTWSRLYNDDYHPVAEKLKVKVKINDTDFDGSSDIITSRWGVNRNIKIGNETKSVNGSSNIDWTFEQMGVVPATGGTYTDVVNFGTGHSGSPASSTIIRTTFRGNAGEDNIHVHLQGVSANNAANANGGSFIRFATSTTTNAGVDVGARRTLTNGSASYVVKTGGDASGPVDSLIVDHQGNVNVVRGIISGDGSGLTNLNASNISDGTIPSARISSTASRTSSSTTTLLQAKAMRDHVNSDDHADTYYRKAGEPTIAGTSVIQKVIGTIPNGRTLYYILICNLTLFSKSVGTISGHRKDGAHNSTGYISFVAGSGNTGSNVGASVTDLSVHGSNVHKLVTLKHDNNDYIAIEARQNAFHEYPTLVFRGESTHPDEIKLVVNETEVSDVEDYDGGNGNGLKIIGGNVKSKKGFETGKYSLVFNEDTESLDFNFQE